MLSGSSDDDGDLLDIADVPASSQVTYKLDGILALHGKQFLENAYRLLLVREPEEGGQRFYLARILAGVSKLQILAEISSSREALELAVNPPGFARALRLRRLARVPIIGPIIGAAFGLEGDSALDIRLRAVEEQLYAELEEDTPTPLTPSGQPPDARAIIADSYLFDRAWYRQQVPELGDADDLIGHFLTTGVFAGRSPSRSFDCDAYLARYFDVRRSGVNPLVHFLLQGEGEGRSSFTVAEARELRQENAKSIAHHSFQCLKVPEVAGEAAILVTRAADGRLKQHVRHYIDALKRQGIAVTLVIVADKALRPKPTDSLSLISGLFVTDSSADESAAWAQILQLQLTFFSASILYLLDDSVFGPFDGDKFARLVEKIRTSAADAFRLTAHDEEFGREQPCFLALKPRALACVDLHRFIKISARYGHYEKASLSCESELCAHLQGQGVRVDELFPADAVAPDRDRTGVALPHWKMLIAAGCPFVSVAALGVANTLADNSGWRELLGAEGYDISLVDIEFSPIHGAAGMADVPPSGAGTQLIAPLLPVPRDTKLPLRVAYIGPCNYDDAQGFAGRGYVAALWQSDFLLNVHPIRQPFHLSQRIASTSDCQCFTGDADLVIVQVNPDEWPGLLSVEQWEILSRARKVVGAWLWEADKTPASWSPAIDTVDSIWAPSRFAADVFERSTRVPVHVMPFCIADRPDSGPEELRQAMRSRLTLTAEQCVILCCLDGADHLECTNPVGLIAAFEISALAQDGWVLVFQGNKLSDPTVGGARFQEMALQTPGVLLFETPLDPAMTDALLDVADIYASAHRADFTAVAIARAMASGKAVVATGYGASSDFLDSTCGYPVPYGLVSRPAGVWADIDVADLARELGKAARAIAAGDLSIGHAARKRITEYASPRELASALQSAAAAVWEVP